jgi:hypothetical protein
MLRGAQPFAWAFFLETGKFPFSMGNYLKGNELT